MTCYDNYCICTELLMLVQRVIITTYPRWIGFRNRLNLTGPWSIAFKHNCYLFLQWSLRGRGLNRDRDGCIITLLLVSSLLSISYYSILTVHHWVSCMKLRLKAPPNWIILLQGNKWRFLNLQCVKNGFITIFIYTATTLPCTFWVPLEWTLQRFQVEFDRIQESQTHSLYQSNQPETSTLIFQHSNLVSKSKFYSHKAGAISDQ